jgi:hypothetical protein
MIAKGAVILEGLGKQLISSQTSTRNEIQRPADQKGIPANQAKQALHCIRIQWRPVTLVEFSHLLRHEIKEVEALADIEGRQVAIGHKLIWFGRGHQRQVKLPSDRLERTIVVPAT